MRARALPRRVTLRGGAGARRQTDPLAASGRKPRGLLSYFFSGAFRTGVTLPHARAALLVGPRPERPAGYWVRSLCCLSGHCPGAAWRAGATRLFLFLCLFLCLCLCLFLFLFLFLCLFLSLARARRRCRGSVLRRARNASPQIRAVACGAAHSLAMDAEGGVWAWGDNCRGQVLLAPYTRRVQLVREEGRDASS